jgi:hypothetical protein
MQFLEFKRLRVLALVLVLANPGCTHDDGGDSPPPAALSASSLSPANGLTGVVLNQGASATFPTAMDASTLDTSTFTVTGPGGPVAGTVTYDATNRIARFTPASHFAANTTYTARLTTGVKNADGQSLGSEQLWGFTTGALVGNGTLEVSSTNPADGGSQVPTNQAIAVHFRPAMDGSTLTSATFTVGPSGGTALTGTVLYAAASRVATLRPATPLLPGTTYSARLSTAVKDAAGNFFASPFVWGFTTAGTTDTSPPTVTRKVPAEAATGVALNQRVSATFSKAMDPATLTPSSFTLTGPGGAGLTGAISYDTPNRIASFLPSSALAPSSVYTPTLTVGVQDLAGNALAVNVAWSFSTGSTGATTGQAPLTLGSTSNFAILAGSTVTNTGPTVLNGNLGLSTGSAVTGFPPGFVNGTLHVADPAAVQAKDDLTAAYIEAAARSTAPIAVSGNLGGQTLAPGLYNTGSSLSITSGDLTLDAGGDVHGVFIFQMGSTLTTTAGRQVILSGGARASNVYWQVGTSATLGTNSSFKGNILADQSITLNSGATLEGRALTRIGAVTLAANTVTIPAP